MRSAFAVGQQTRVDAFEKRDIVDGVNDMEREWKTMNGRRSSGVYVGQAPLTRQPCTCLSERFVGESAITGLVS